MSIPAASDSLTLLRSTARQFKMSRRFERARVAAAGLRDVLLQQEPNSRSSSIHSLPLTESEAARLPGQVEGPPAFELHMPEHIREKRYARHSPSRELYSLLPEGHFRLLRVIPGTRRGEYTSQLVETSVECAVAEHGYSVLQVVSEGEDGRQQQTRPRYQQQQERHQPSPIKTRTDSSSSDFWHRSTNEDTVYFPLLSLGGGEHIIEIPWKVKRALEEVMVARWDFFHSGAWEEGGRKAWRSERRRGVGREVGGGGYGGSADGETERGGKCAEEAGAKAGMEQEDGDGDRGAEVGADGDGDGDSDSGQGEDFYLWIRDVCVDLRDREDREQQKQLEVMIWENATEVVVAKVPSDIGGKVEVDRIFMVDGVKPGVLEVVRETQKGMSNNFERE